MINAFVYKEDDGLYLVPLASEKRIKLNAHKEIYTKCDNLRPLRGESIALCWYDEPTPGVYKSKPTVIVDLTYKDVPILASNLKFDSLVDMAYTAAIEFTKRKSIASK